MYRTYTGWALPLSAIFFAVIFTYNTGCQKEPDDDDSAACDTDNDGDGYVSEECGGDDCNDNSESTYPGAPDNTADGVDQDCDGEDGPAGDDDDDTTPDHDQDGDGFDGMPWGDDCDDSDPDVNPDAEEVPCDGIDNDCDPLTLDEPDEDGDTYTVCDDCDDTDPLIYPGAQENVNDGGDSDCYGGPEVRVELGYYPIVWNCNGTPHEILDPYGSPTLTTGWPFDDGETLGVCYYGDDGADVPWEQVHMDILAITHAVYQGYGGDRCFYFLGVTPAEWDPTNWDQS
ncbi:hypothetical protein KKC88_03155 [Patescibacteria group bacterium]|nr:hypothetical protein [Patescibacteria group bacterium]MBU1673420.1 hypothetical protein [Patescibacteria group bacterium]MBU1963324.1 hypothetical protein [Patescibacteria group bacterium]